LLWRTMVRCFFFFAFALATGVDAQTKAVVDTSGDTHWWWGDDSYFAPDLDNPKAIISLPYDRVSSEEMFTPFAGKIILHEDTVLCLGIGCAHSTPPAPPGSLDPPDGDKTIEMTLGCPSGTPKVSTVKSTIVSFFKASNPDTKLHTKDVTVLNNNKDKTLTVTIAGANLDADALLASMLDPSFEKTIATSTSCEITAEAKAEVPTLVCPVKTNSTWGEQTDYVWWTGPDGDWSDSVNWEGGRPSLAKKVHTPLTVQTPTATPPPCAPPHTQ
jgi:hypothetical protein